MAASDDARSAPVDRFGHGRVCYLQIPSIDPMKSAEFYEQTFGWRIERPYPSFEAPNLIGQWTADRPIIRGAGVLVWINVEHMDVALKAVLAAGGEVLAPPSQDDSRWIATISDPDGNEIGIVQHRPR